MKIYALKNCDTCKKALAWLSGKNAAFNVHDVRADGMTTDDVRPIVEAVGWEAAVNRRSTTWRNLNDDDKADLSNDKAVDLIVQNPTLMKRPVYVSGDTTIVGFDSSAKEKLESLI
ncbi:MAG: Spx/MgsR family RNA polymerase-binding regulatory protein [Rhizobiaceae bacterium]|nr:Spx/MgsR family RNA polymerase-binding regulatory protein [Rhizobiaceae bacterium]